MPSPTLARHFAAPSRTRGEALARAGAVDIVQLTAASADAHVAGTADYVLSVTVLRKTALLGCSCPHADGGAFCKHLWATLLVLEDRPDAASLTKALQRATAARLVEVETEGPDHWEFPVYGSDDEWDDDWEEPHGGDPDQAGTGHSVGALPGRHPTPAWEALLDRAAWEMRMATMMATPDHPVPRGSAGPPADRQFVYQLDGTRFLTGQPAGLLLEVLTRTRARTGGWGAPRRMVIPTEAWRGAPDPRDQEVARRLLGAAPLHDHGGSRMAYVLRPEDIEHVVPALCASGRAQLLVGPPAATLTELRWDVASESSRVSSAETSAESSVTPIVPWRFAVAVVRDGAHWALAGDLVRGPQRRALDAVPWVHPVGLALIDGALTPMVLDGLWPLMAALRTQPRLPLGDDPWPALAKLHALPRVPDVAFPPDLAVRSSTDAPVPGVRFEAAPALSRRGGAPLVAMRLRFWYGGVPVAPDEDGATRVDASARTVHHRDRAAEQQGWDRIMAMGATVMRDMGTTWLGIPREVMGAVARTLATDGWRVEADGCAIRAPGAVRASVRSGVDWFDLEGTVPYGDTSVALADVLEARRQGVDAVPLPDGSLGLLPQDWLDRLGPLLASGQGTATGTRFRRSQLALLDVLLSTLPEVDVDAVCTQQREALRGFARVAPADPPATFTGVLRPYQREGLGWMHFLRDFGFGGCLADDMGLGKTIQVLALLDSRRLGGHGPSLVVVPRSLVFNWRAEAARFAPALRVADWSGAARAEAAWDPSAADVALVTYGVLRRDVARLAEIAFDYVVLDEAQAIKNHGTATAKACRILQASHRLALSGTPVENRVEELWSLLEFLNPGLLGASSRFAEAVRAGTAGQGGDDVLARALRPVLLRRTKQEVAPELPPRLERTLEVELEPRQRAFYERVRAAVRTEVLSQVASRGLGRSRLHILEGLLRLRQAACHPVLADARKGALPSAKLDALVPALVSAAAEGHKALVFSQFTAFLALVREALDEEGVTYGYLDGRTRDRQAAVARFQENADCPVMLVSLKAGGHGLNLTAADHVYLLDPWWNPAVEAQAIDRAHRIGRTRPVIATRLVARDTIEEKILALQAGKRALADAILAGDRGGLAAIGREELELLLA
ncbi:MAG: DEAD/DEAH box helicase [Gemmatimonadetes bacterium]|nr:DEAD/DEAH box helicase [Gemmatimonadota bacterium]